MIPVIRLHETEGIPVAEVSDEHLACIGYVDTHRREELTRVRAGAAPDRQQCAVGRETGDAAAARFGHIDRAVRGDRHADRIGKVAGVRARASDL
jgi:hypothetical protein